MIKTTMKCNKIGPLDDLNSSENSSSLKFGVFANNGSGKTFISRMFRLAENPQSLSADTEGNIPTDYLIRFKNNNASFTFKVSKESTDIEDLEIELKNGIASTVPNPYYLYHVFNQDYVDENIRNQGYVKDGSDVSLQTYILGKANIDLSDDKKALANLDNQIKETQSKIENCIANNLKEISQIPNIRRLSENHNINIDRVIQANGNIDCETKTIKLYLSDMKRDISEIGFADLIYNNSRKEKVSSFAQINKAIDWSLIARIINSSYSRGNSNNDCPSYERTILFKIELFRTKYDFSYGEMKEHVNDLWSFSRFVDISLNNHTSNSKMGCRFRNELVKRSMMPRCEFKNDIN